MASMTPEQSTEVLQLIEDCRRLLSDMHSAILDQERSGYLEARAEYLDKSARLNAILPTATDPLPG